ncbi:hypothetical protein H5410_036361 [Solanum commersonii]|uniref:Uncharacterized protein n=1 Tax=Solanum commersonii TaxID=4109 RepID=A0A9J5Y3Z4_SOLCO|nr:hypothetical protein H5410_036361 [Solanum commersonii]
MTDVMWQAYTNELYNSALNYWGIINTLLALEIIRSVVTEVRPSQSALTLLIARAYNRQIWASLHS